MDDGQLRPGERLRAAAATTWAATRLAAQAVVPPLRRPPIGEGLSGPQRLSHGLVLLLSGIGGESFLTQDLAAGLDRACTPEAIEAFPWATDGFPLVGNLLTYRQNLEQASRLARRIRQYRHDYPQQPIHVIGYSGGAAEAVLALERLGADDCIDAAILLAATLSPTYDLARALRRTRFGIYNFRNPNDRTLLGAGMILMGTLDRRHVPAAGMVGFQTASRDFPGRCRSISDEVARVALGPADAAGRASGRACRLDPAPLRAGVALPDSRRPQAWQAGRILI